MGEHQKALFAHNLDILSKASKWLKRSFNICSAYGLKEYYSEEELDDFEALLLRYNRLCGIFFNKTLRSLDAVELVAQGTLIDVINRAHKRAIIDSADLARKMKELRNEMVHQYQISELKQTFADVLDYTPTLLQWVDNVSEYSKVKLNCIN